ncbi:MAG: fumarylacetoacetate hydrolase family protein [Candidatus Latescibacterota bacterium]|jgi:2-keto-4-pentenoate hydratase/2-oxohepta-3-ene-1,7-dioic acid hydratase in catechol pathway
MKLFRYQTSHDSIEYGASSNDGPVFRIDGDIFGDFDVTDEQSDVAKLLAPIEPRSILGIGLNYRRHAEESGMALPEYPVVFFKGPSALQHPEEPIVLPRHLRSDEVDYECELAIVIGKTCKNASREDALSYVLGYTCANDVSARDWQIRRGGSQWSRGKSFDTFCPLGPSITTVDELGAASDLGIRTRINGETLQDWTTGDLIFDVQDLVAFLSGSTTLFPGTVILTGTPHGVGMAAQPPRWLRPGDNVEVEIDGIGTLVNPVVEEQ